MNPFFEFLSGRKSFKCNLCFFVQKAPQQFQDPHGNYSNTELSNGSYEFYASDTYMARTPMEPSYCFLIDISPSSFANNVPFYAIAAIKETVRGFRFNGGRSVSLKIILFDNQLHLPKFKPNGSVTISTFGFSTDIKYIPYQVN